jgi:predicted DCC family thiol-disulfide oxidoreductase YuxK
MNEVAIQAPPVAMAADKTVVLFDGVCNFCDHTINFLIDHDPADRFRFAAQQSDIGQKIMHENGLGDLMLNTMIVFDNGQVLTQSTAALRLAKYMPMPWRMLNGFMILPAFVRNRGYKLFAKYRYKLFGQVEACRMPTPEIRAKFL